MTKAFRNGLEKEIKMKHQLLKKTGLLGIALLLLVLSTSLGAAAGSPAVKVYEVTITNLTDGQALTPPLLVTHRKPIHVFQKGEAASLGIQELAENGNAAPLLDALVMERQVYDVVMGTAPLVPEADPGETGFSHSESFMIDSARGAKYLSFASMLICTNDGFAGLDGIRLPDRMGQSKALYARSYDAGTEINTEDFADIVPPCQGLIGISSDDAGTGTTNPELAEGGVVHGHQGILGGDDLVPEIHGWMEPAVHVVITRVQ
jgi:hypothetical protein